MLNRVHSLLRDVSFPHISREAGLESNLAAIEGPYFGYSVDVYNKIASEQASINDMIIVAVTDEIMKPETDECNALKWRCYWAAEL